jgi:hypothetical protein
VLAPLLPLQPDPLKSKNPAKDPYEAAVGSHGLGRRSPPPGLTGQQQADIEEHGASDALVKGHAHLSWALILIGDG